MIRGSRSPMTKFAAFSILIIALLSILIFSLFSATVSATDYTREPPYKYREMLDDYDSATSNFTTYQPGDTVTVVDVIVLVLYNESAQRTYIWLESEGTDIESAENLVLRGDQSKKYIDGDEIEVIFTIRGYTAGEYYDYGLEDITYIEKKERVEEQHGIDILVFHKDLPDRLDNNYGRFLITVVIWLFIALVALFVLDPVIRWAVQGTETQIDDIILGIIRRPILILIILYGLVDSLERLELSDEIMYYFRLVYSVGFILMMTWIAIKIFKGVLIEVGKQYAKKTQARVEHVLIPILDKIGSIVIVFMGLAVLMGFFGIDLTLYLAGFGLTGLVIAFAAQDTLSNFFGGIFLIIEPYFKEGDTIQIEEDFYEVKKIGMRTTQLYDIFKHIMVVVPNDKLANEMLINLTEPDRRIKDSVKVGVAYGCDTKKVERLLVEIASAHPDIITNEEGRKPFARFYSFGDSALDFGVHFWVKDLDDRYRVKHELNHVIHERFAKEGIEIPFPQMDVHMKNE